MKADVEFLAQAIGALHLEIAAQIAVGKEKDAKIAEQAARIAQLEGARKVKKR